MKRFESDQVVVLTQEEDHLKASVCNPNKIALPYNTILCSLPIKAYDMFLIFKVN